MYKNTYIALKYIFVFEGLSYALIIYFTGTKGELCVLV